MRIVRSQACQPLFLAFSVRLSHPKLASLVLFPFLLFDCCVCLQGRGGDLGYNELCSATVIG